MSSRNSIYTQNSITPVRVALYKRVLKNYGADSQIRVFREEAGELLTVISQYERGRVPIGEVAEECADYKIMGEQLAVITGIQAVYREEERHLRELAEYLPIKHVLHPSVEKKEWKPGITSLPDSRNLVLPEKIKLGEFPNSQKYRGTPLSPERTALYLLANKQSSPEVLYMVLGEKIGEVLSVLARHRRQETTLAEVADKVAAYRIMGEQMATWLGFDAVSDIEQYKLARLEHRLNKEYGIVSTKKTEQEVGIER